MSSLPQSETGILSELRVKQKLESFGLLVHKPIPDIGIDFEVSNPFDKTKFAKIQVKGRNPKFIKTYRWFQLRVQKREMELAKIADIPAKETWKRKLRMVDFFILDSIYYDEMWVLSQEQAFKLIKLNEHQYGLRPDNFFTYEEPIKGRQKEMNLEAMVPDKPIMEQFSSCKNNFSPILSFLGMK
jgi:hypothetical protein